MTKKLILFVAVVALLGVMAAACAQSPVLVYIVVTATPDGTTAQPVSPTELASTAMAAATVVQPSPSPEMTPTSAPTVESEPVGRQIQVYVAEQPFQRGRMIWIEPISQIWVLVETEPGIGYWEIYEDTFKEGDVELDPALVAPTGLSQPIRGFGLIWRNGENVRQELGWATDIEIGFVTNYEFLPGEPSPETGIAYGYHFMQNQYGEWYRFNEINGTWQMVTRTDTAPTSTPSTPSS